ncbi:MAG: antibiotic biosynthesis monooxygenase [Bacteroidetes bacterium]|nr:antibiotic biosynthesis monooxygenase [Bacteroidota bacterium]
MLIRLVRLTLKPEAVTSFQQEFSVMSPKIRQYPGCHQLHLWMDLELNHILTTYSEWDSESSLNDYRESSLFKTNWALVKPMFAAPAMVHSYVTLPKE